MEGVVCVIIPHTTYCTVTFYSTYPIHVVHISSRCRTKQQVPTTWRQIQAHNVSMTYNGVHSEATSYQFIAAQLVNIMYFVQAVESRGTLQMFPGRWSRV